MICMAWYIIYFLSSLGFMWRIPVDKPQTLESLVWLVIKIKISAKNERHRALYYLCGTGPPRILSVNNELVHPDSLSNLNTVNTGDIWLKQSMKIIFKRKCALNYQKSGTSMMIQWLRLHLSNAGAQVLFLVGKLRAHMLRGQPKMFS